MQLVYLILTFLRIIITLYVIVSKQMKKGHLFQRNKENSININWLSHIRKPWKIVTSSNNSQSVRKAKLVCDILLRNLKTWKSIEIMLLVVYNNVLKSSWSGSICWCDSVEQETKTLTKCSYNSSWVIKKNKKTEITSICCTLYLCNKISIRKPLVDISHIQ